MPETVTVERLVIMVNGHHREAGALPGRDIVAVDLTVKNPIGSPGSTRRTPFMELHDDVGRIYPAEMDPQLMNPVPPTESVDGTCRFEVAEEAMGLELVIAPGSDEEVGVSLD